MIQVRKIGDYYECEVCSMSRRLKAQVEGWCASEASAKAEASATITQVIITCVRTCVIHYFLQQPTEKVAL